MVFVHCYNWYCMLYGWFIGLMLCKPIGIWKLCTIGILQNIAREAFFDG